ncbi:MAG: family glucokinase [Paenibacillus sp.]|jgi:glucokinase|nr:family glucokinase [Paenibacillus sp.]
MSEKIYIGVDLGGTSVKVGICNEEGKLLHTFEGPTGAEEGAQAVLDRIAQYVKQIVSDSSYSWEQVAGVGAGIAGFIDLAQGIVIESVNLKWHNVEITKELNARLNLPVKVNNDANVAALGEAWSGAGKGVQHLICFTLGTGVGGGIIINGKIIEGFRGMAAELGHMKVVPDLEAIQCGCGQMGCVETVSSATGIIRMAKDAVGRGEPTTLSELESISAKDVFDAAKDGDEVAIRIVKRAAYYLAKAMAAVAVVLNPQRFIVGGGVSRAGDILFDEIRKVYKQYVPAVFVDGVDIVPAQLGNDAGIVGAAGLNLN